MGMSESEALLRWLGFVEKTVTLATTGGKDSTYGWWQHETREWWQTNELPDFRASNEWAGALLDALGPLNGVHLHTDDSMTEPDWWLDTADGRKGRPTKSWRDAVVDAVLLVIGFAPAAVSPHAQ